MATSTVQLEQGVGSWAEFQIIDKTTDEPIVLVDKDQIRVFYKKHGELVFTQKTPLVEVVDKNNIIPGENFTEIGFGWYAIYFDETDLDTLETFTWVVIPDDPGVLDFKQWDQQFDVVVGTDFIQTIDDIEIVTLQTGTDVNQGFADTETALTDLQDSADTADVKLDGIQSDVTEIKNTMPGSIHASFVEGG